jgi:hypothetical protein
MATQQPLRLTRNQLAQFLKDQEQIRAFENLFQTVEPLPDNLASIQAQLDQLALDLAQQELELDQLTVVVNQQGQDLAQLVGLKYGAFYDTTTQTAAAINTAYPITFNTTDRAVGFSRGTPTSRIVVTRQGLYNFQFSAQLDNTSGGNHLAYIWARVNGTDVPQSASEVRLQGNSSELVAAWNFVVLLNANDYFELMWSVDDTAVQIVARAAAAPVPAIPSVLLSVTAVPGYTT